MRHATLCFLIDEESKPNKICLGMKKRGFGAGRWNGFGGKVEKKESIVDAVIRETKEEINVVIHSDDLERVAQLRFKFVGNPKLDQFVHVFIVKRWEGLPKESDEMAPDWYFYKDIPFEDMWTDDIYWLPKVLEGHKVEAMFSFGDEDEIQEMDMQLHDDLIHLPLPSQGIFFT